MAFPKQMGQLLPGRKSHGHLGQEHRSGAAHAPLGGTDLRRPRDGSETGRRGSHGWVASYGFIGKTGA